MAVPDFCSSPVTTMFLSAALAMVMEVLLQRKKKNGGKVR
jgi:preprotein translocase subunit SecG